MIRITIDFMGAQVSIRERLHACIASGQTFVWQEATRTSAAWHPSALPVWQPSSCQTPDATAVPLMIRCMPTGCGLSG